LYSAHGNGDSKWYFELPHLKYTVSPLLFVCPPFIGIHFRTPPKCFFCGSKKVKKNGRRNSQQRYKCCNCGRQFDGGRRRQSDELWTDYSAGKQTAARLAAKYGCSCKTIYRHRKARIQETFPQPAKANIIMDTTYFGRCFGVMVLMDSISGQALSVREVKHETNASMPKR
ncbi:MAG: hypothetical protein ACFNTM_00590, partial [Cardiobacterium sp.]